MIYVGRGLKIEDNTSSILANYFCGLNLPFFGTQFLLTLLKNIVLDFGIM